MGGPKCPSFHRCDDKIILITGASSGIGFETAKELAERGGRIIMACRNIQKGRQAIDSIRKQNPAAKLDLRLVDVAKMADIRRFVAELKKNYDHVDILINNAGVIYQPHHITEDGFEITLATNYFGRTH